jgi:hypothetical protein
MKTKKLVSYRMDEHTLEVIESIKQKLELENNSAVLRRAIALLKLASESEKVILIQDGNEREVLL